jgi:hypothetical protein
MYRWLLALSLAAGTAQAQSAAGTIDPGMTKQQVIERLGRPSTVRTFQQTTYLLYPNSCGRSCGMQDLVVLDNDAVVDAVFRSPHRHYTGTSSSPVATRPDARNAHNAALRVPSTTTRPADSARTSTSHVPADSSVTSTSHAPADSSATSTSEPPKPPRGV